MSRPGTLKPQPAFSSWWKHLRAKGKREAAKSERKEAAKDARAQASAGTPE